MSRRSRRLLVAISARSLAAVEEHVTLPQFRMLVVLATHGETKLVTLAGRLAVNSSTAMRMADRLTTAGLIDRQVNPANRREIALRLTEPGRHTITFRAYDVAQNASAARTVTVDVGAPPGPTTRPPAAGFTDTSGATASFTAKWPRPPKPMTATFVPGPACQWRRGE